LRWYEKDANRWASGYFRKHFLVNWNAIETPRDFLSYTQKELEDQVFGMMCEALLDKNIAHKQSNLACCDEAMILRAV